MFDLLKRLCETPGVSGSESEVRGVILNEIKEYADCSVDRLGNLIVSKKGKERPKTRLMLCAHMDEVGLIATTVMDDGFIKFETVGGIDTRVLIGRRVIFPRSGACGIIGTKAVHLQKADERKSYPSVDQLAIDIGAFSREDALQYVTPGDIAVFDSGYVEFGDGRIKARAIDDRIGCTILIGMIQSELPYDCTFVFTVQEEVGLRGAKTAAFAVKPEVAIVVDATTAADISYVDEHKQACRLGEGAVLSFMDHRTMYDRGLFELAQTVARENGIACQINQAVKGGNDSGAIHIANNGVRTLAVSLPCRYLHSPSCVISRGDAEQTSNLVRALAAKIAGNAPC